MCWYQIGSRYRLIRSLGIGIAIAKQKNGIQTSLHQNTLTVCQTSLFIKYSKVSSQLLVESLSCGASHRFTFTDQN